jgi:phospholipid/cholesterol/gamma-HCH transport system permease protein
VLGRHRLGAGRVLYADNGRFCVSSSTEESQRRHKMWSGTVALKPVRAAGGFFAFALDTCVTLLTTRLAVIEMLQQTWFVARVSMFPALVLAIPFVVLTVFTFNVLLVEFGAADFSGTGAAIGGVNQLGPLVTVLVVAGSGASAMCADLGARTIREELDALRVMGIDPIQRLVVPRVLAATLVALMLSSLVTLAGLIGGFFFAVFFQHVTPGAFVTGLTFITGLTDVVVSMVKATAFGLVAGLIACFQGINVDGGPAGVGNAVNETVVYSFVLLFVINVVLTAVGFEVAK